MASFQRPWQTHYDSHVPQTIEYPSITVYEFIERAALGTPDKVALEFFGKRTDYKTMLDKVRRMAGGLWSLGLRPGDRVILLLPNCPQFVVAYLALMRLGCVAVMANPLNVERELVFKFKDSGARSLISLDFFSQRINNIRKEVDLERVIYTRLTEEMPFPVNLLFPLAVRKVAPKVVIPRDDRTHFFRDLLAMDAQPPAKEETAADPAELAVLIYSGGTTGVSKGIMLSHFALVSNAMQVCSWGELRDDDSFLLVLPAFHGFGLSVGLNAPLSRSGRVVLLPNFDPVRMLKTVQKSRPTFFAGVPAMYVALKERPDFRKYDITSLRGMFCGAAPLPLEVLREFESIAGAPIIEGYGLTEIVTAISCNPMHGQRKPGTVGIPFPDIDAKIVDLETGTRELPPGEAGELLLKGPDLMMGYWNQPESTAEALRDGWLYTGDICTRDEEGYITVVDRKKDLVIVSGFNVFPREIDEVLHEHPKVLDAVAVGLPHPSKGEYIKAYVVPRSGETVTGEEVIAFCKKRLSAYMVPKAVEVRAELPKSMVGKVLRRALREEELAKGNPAAGTPDPTESTVHRES
jgi:long-chain acyl-CoA synthetase